ncbi:DUF4123 domain-containing protein [Ectopseudomonas guguanensis]|uniref:DUF4123 domain-containing protein n=1 Tax=Ectopseudomonas guguanensis TaxID=1198456 RepID=UPI002854CF70|nr:DUF4123 domain-containing protein [Pseudomonas guguanensis]MDR8016677.1 DUF4123 domain-containing protein [Pseudomonas guguanensis]
MNTNAVIWLEMLGERASEEHLPHLDLLVDTTGSSYSLETLRALPTPPDQALLLEGLPESKLAEQGPVLLRFDWRDNGQRSALADLTATLFPQQRLLALLSPWPFERLAAHLAYHLQAEWNQGRSSGLLRFYDPRLFLAYCETLDPQQARLFHAPAYGWHWLDRDEAHAQLAGMPMPAREVELPEQMLQLNNPQVAMLVAWTSAELMRRDYDLQPQDYALAKRESLIRHLVHGQLAADRAGCAGAQRDEYIFDWLAKNSAVSPPREQVMA